MSARNAYTRVTLREVAKHAGVHPATVSRALNPETEGMVHAETLRRVRASARALNYRTNRIARSLRTARSLTVGVLIPDITNPLFPRIVRGIDDTLFDAHYTSLIAYTDGRNERVGDRIERLHERGVDGLIVATARRRDPALEALATEGMPLVLINRATDSRTISSVTADDAGGSTRAVDHLFAQGHRRIAFLGAPRTLSTGWARLQGFEAAMAAHGLEVDPSLTALSQTVTLEEGRALCSGLLQKHPEVTAIVAANDLMALGCYDALRVAGLEIPDDISVVGFNDMQFADRFDPPLTTLRFDHYEMGAAAARMLLRRLTTGDTTPTHVQLETTLIVRESTRRVPPPSD